jgi:apolipoprotein D and lipocalin family protein
MRRWVTFCLLAVLTGCVGYPSTIQPVENFDIDRYLGTWYEIARLDHSFERGLERVTANYSLNDDGSVRVLNSGFSAAEGKLENAEGKARFVASPQQGYLKVSFFGPFYGSYVIFGLDEDYQHAYVSGPDHDYLWLLARTPTVSESVYLDFLQRAEFAGFDTSQLIRVAH